MRSVLSFLVFVFPVLSQTASPDTQLTQALLNEIRLLRQDLQTTAITIQRVQIVMYRLQSESALLNRATQRLDEARNRCTQAQNQHKITASQMERFEQDARNAQNPADRKGLEDRLANIKSAVEMWTNEEQQCHAREAEADSQYRAEQAKMSQLEDQLEKLDRALAGVTAPPR